MMMEEQSVFGLQAAMTEKKAIESEIEWAGVLTIENTKWIADRMQRLLTGKRYVSVTVNEGNGFKPVTHVGQKLAKPIADYRSILGGLEVAGFRLSDSYTWPFSTSIPSTSLYKDLPSTGDEIHFHFEYNKVCITLRVPAGHRLYWVFACVDDRG
jgi:hypothetical protein